MRTIGVVVMALAVCGVGWSHATAPAVADEQVLAEGPDDGELSAYGGTVAFSDHEPGAGWRLKLWNDGKVRTLPVEPRSVPFDVDLGPDENGRTTVVYSRCRVEPRGSVFLGQGCDLYRYSNGVERRVRGVSRAGHSEHHPSIWRDRIAFARYLDEGRGQDFGADRLYLREEDGLRELPRGTLRLSGQIFAATFARLERLDLRGTRVAFEWRYRSDECPGPQDPPERGDPASVEREQIWLAGRDGSRRKVDTACFDADGAVFGPVLTDRGLFHARARGVLADEPPRSVSLVRSDSSARTRDERPADPDTVAVAVGDGVVAEWREVAPVGMGRTYRLVIRD